MPFSAAHFSRIYLWSCWQQKSSRCPVPRLQKGIRLGSPPRIVIQVVANRHYWTSMVLVQMLPVIALPLRLYRWRIFFILTSPFRSPPGQHFRPFTFPHLYKWPSQFNNQHCLLHVCWWHQIHWVNLMFQWPPVVPVRHNLCWSLVPNLETSIKHN